MAKTVSTPVGDAPVIPLTILIAGLYLAWFGVHYWGSDTKYPTTPIQHLLQGKPSVPPTGQEPPAHAVLAADVQALKPDQGATSSEQQSSSTGQPVITSNSSGTPAANIALGQMLATTYGWFGNDWLCLKTGWQEESGWRTDAANVPSDPYNHAYGIPQANPGTKMASAGPNWKTDAQTQITWGLIYIKQTYGSPSQVPHWSPSGPTAGYVGY